MVTGFHTVAPEMTKVFHIWFFSGEILKDAAKIQVDSES